MNAVWVAQLDMKDQRFSGSWLTVHGSRQDARRVIEERADIHGFDDLHRRAAAQDWMTESDVSSSAAANDGLREITWVINRHTVEDPVIISSARLSTEIQGEVVITYSDGSVHEVTLDSGVRR